MSDIINDEIVSLQRKILKNKILLKIIIDNRSFLVSFYNYAHLTSAVLSPVFVLINSSYHTQWLNIVSVVFGTLAASMIKIKDVLRFNKIRNIAKEQIQRYSNLYMRIERELIKHANIPEDFLYWVTREFNQISASDPEPDYRDIKEFKVVCDKHNIQRDDDIIILERLTTQAQEQAQEQEQKQTHDNAQEQEQKQAHDNAQEQAHDNAQKQAQEQTQEQEPQGLHKSLSIHFTRPPKKDSNLKWTMERLKALEE